MPYYEHIARMGFLVLLIGALHGCGSGGATVKGTVKYDGKAVDFGSVVFAVGDKFVDARIEPDGTYQAKGVPYGAAKIAVHSKMEKLSEAPVAEKPDNVKGRPVKERNKKGVVLPEIYTKADTSGLTLNVDRAKMEFDISLKKEE